jgi:DNA-binding GntR family transcriptional regulator
MTIAGHPEDDGLTRYAALARQILDAAEAEGWPAGHRLAEPRLAERLSVSRTPVRKALELLERCGLARRSEKGGLELAAEPGSPGFDRSRLPGSATEEHARTLVAERFAGIIGEQVTLAEVAARYGLSRAAAQDVLEALRRDGLIERSEGHHWLFTPGLVDEASFEESTRFRLLIEPAALAEPGFAANPNRLEALRRQHAAVLAEDPSEPPRLAELMELDAEFHAFLGDSSGNRFLAAAIRQHTELRRVGEYHRQAMRDRVRAVFAEHLAILDAIAGGDLAGAQARLRAHLEASLDHRPTFAKVRALAFRRLTRR